MQMASFLSYPIDHGPEKSPSSGEGLNPLPDFSLDITTESFLEVETDRRKKCDDSPVTQAPLPSFPKVSPPFLMPDPDLCLTPDKPTRPSIQVEKPKHVHFEVPVAGRGSVENNDINKENVVVDTASEDSEENVKVYSYVKHDKKQPETKFIDANENIVPSNENGVHIFAKLNSNIPESNKPQREAGPKKHVTIMDEFDEPPVPRQPPPSGKVYFPRLLPKEAKPGVITAEEHVFQRPELHSTLKVNQEMKQLKSAQLDVEQAVEDKLHGSPATRTQFKEKVTSRVNTAFDSRPLYQSLEGTDVERAEDIIKRAEVQKKSLVKGPNLESTRIQDSRFPEPNIMDLFTANLQVETCSYNIDSLPKFEEPLKIGPEESAFELYKHLRIWEGLP